MRALWDDIDATAVFSIQLYESYKHFYALNRYLDVVNYRPLTEEELIDIRRRNLDTRIDDPVAELTRYMLSEHFAAYFFLRVSQQAREPVLAELARYIAKDEFRHTQFAFDLLDARLKREPACRDRILQAGQCLPPRRRRCRADGPRVRKERSAGDPHAEPADPPALRHQPDRLREGPRSWRIVRSNSMATH